MPRYRVTLLSDSNIPFGLVVEAATEHAAISLAKVLSQGCRVNNIGELEDARFRYKERGTDR